jgi:transcriptional regulator with XRE-family HTH domain
MEELSFGERLVQFRKERNFTRDNMSYILDVNKDTYRSWERNYGVPGIDMLNKISNAFGISLDELLGRKADSEVINKALEIEKTKKRRK